ncbi:enoyl-CoA hydratase-related protein [Dactylosporangium sp. CA-092794]|uniref:enoyl-CoA hydratase-related protein n=1 Tax=Dactylosporangium sp. CA-092794 TaxID=3239929 RepID=UPI003D93198E
MEVVLDDPGRKSNTVNRRYFDGMAAVLDDVEANRDRVRGIILRSAKRSFFSGDDIGPNDVSPDDAAAAYELMAPVKDQLRRLERTGRPVVAALTGSALGFGLEIGLASHYRVGLDAPGVVYGLPEVTMGLLPGGGGVVRVTRMLGVARAFLEVLGAGRMLPPARALEIGILDELAAGEEAMLGAARAWIEQQWHDGDRWFSQRWERDGYSIPGGVKGSAELARSLPSVLEWLDDRVGDAPLAAPRAILDVAIESTTTDVDTAFKLETAAQLQLLANPVTPRLSKLVFVDVRLVRDGLARPDGPVWRPRTVAILGDGEVASALRTRAAGAGLTVSAAAATPGSTDLVLDCRPQPAGDAGHAPDGDGLVIVVEPSTAPAADDAARMTLWGLDEETPLAEITRASESTTRRAFDAAVAIGLIPVLAQDAAPTFVQRLTSAYADEVTALVAEGNDAHAVRRAVRRAGFRAPVPGLPVLDAGSAALEPADGPDPATELRAQRLLFAVAIEAWRAVDDGVVGSVTEANVASVLGAGFPAWTGGAVQYLEAYPDGPSDALVRLGQISAEQGPRLAAPASLIERLTAAAARD